MTSIRKLRLDFKSLQITNKLINCSRLSLPFLHNSLLNLKLFHMPLQFTFLREEFCTDYANVNWYLSSLTIAYCEQEKCLLHNHNLITESSITPSMSITRFTIQLRVNNITFFFIGGCFTTLSQIRFLHVIFN